MFNWTLAQVIMLFFLGFKDFKDKRFLKIKDTQCWVFETCFELVFGMTPGTTGTMAEIHMVLVRTEVVSLEARSTIRRQRMLWSSLVAIARAS